MQKGARAALNVKGAAELYKMQSYIKYKKEQPQGAQSKKREVTVK